MFRSFISTANIHLLQLCLKLGYLQTILTASRQEGTTNYFDNIDTGGAIQTILTELRQECTTNYCNVIDTGGHCQLF